MIKYITFDVYGTLVDVETAIIKYFIEISNGKIGFGEARTLFNRWDNRNFKNINHKMISFKESIRQTLTPILKKYNLYSNKNLKLFVKKYASAKPYKGVIDFLDSLNIGIVAISNIDNDMIKKCSIFDMFDHVITSEDVGFVYKPDYKVFKFALKKLNCRNIDILHMSSSPRADIDVTIQLNIKNCYIKFKI